MKYITTMVLLVITSILVAQSDPAAIIRASRNTMQISSFESVSTLTITDSRGNQRIRKSTMASKTYPDNTEKRIIKFLEPQEVKGTGILIFDYENKADDMWIFLPALKKTRRIVSREKSRSFMGSEFTNADMTAPSMDDFEYTLLGEVELDGMAYWKIRATARNMDIEEEYGYTSSESWIGKTNYLARKTLFFDYNGDNFKTIINNSFELIDPGNGKYMVTAMTAENHLTGRSSAMKLEKVSLADTKDEYFTVTYLER